MDITEIIIEESPWFILLCILTGAIYSFFLYRKNTTWGKGINRFLAALRFILVTILCYLLLVPLVKQTRNLVEKPILVLAMDNSESMLLKDSNATRQLVNQIDMEYAKWRDKGLEVDVLSFSDLANNGISDLEFEENQTDLSGLLRKISGNYENRNLIGAILVSDGINNFGYSPEYLNLEFPVYTVGVGDTTVPNDLYLQNVAANKIAYSGNNYPVRVELGNKGFQGEKAEVVLYVDGVQAQSKTVDLATENGVQDVQFILTAKKVGKHQIAAVVKTRESEWNKRNNRKEIYIEVIDARQRILIYAHAPHPDIKAIKNVIEGQQNYEFDIRYEGDREVWDPKKPYDLVVFHQIPSRTTNMTEFTKTFGKVSGWYITGTQSDLSKLNQIQKIVQFTSQAGQPDNVFPVFNANNDQFNYENEQAGMLAQYPPVSVPFGEFKMAANTSVILYQRIGNIQTEKPILCVATEDNKKTAVFFGEGMWKWRMMEYAQNENYEAFDGLMSKVLQYVVTAADKRKLRVYPVSDEFSTDENAQLDIEVYNDIFEPLFNKEITVDLEHEGKVVQYKFVNSESASGLIGASASRFGLGNLEKGVYNFTASTMISGKKEIAKGSFIVNESNLEALNTSADFNLLRRIAENNQGEFYKNTELNQLSAKFINGNFPDKIINSFEELKELIHSKWIFFFLLGLVTIEWVVRKYNGAI